MNCLFCQHQLKLITGDEFKHWQCIFCPDTHFYSTKNKDEIKSVNIYFSYRGVKYLYVEVYDLVWQQQKGFVAFFKPNKAFSFTDVIVEFKTPPNINPLNILKKFLTYKNFS